MSSGRTQPKPATGNSNNPKGRVPRALPVGIYLKSGILI